MTIRLIKLSVLYLVLGMTMGIAMGMSHDFLLRPVHAHVNLLGFAVLAIAAFVFHAAAKGPYLGHRPASLEAPQG